MGSSVDILYAFAMWNSFCRKNAQTNHTPKNFWISWGYTLDKIKPLFVSPSSSDGICKG